MGAREALAEALAGELDMDLTPEFLAATDRVLIRLYMSGYIVAAGEYPEAAEVEPA